MSKLFPEEVIEFIRNNSKGVYSKDLTTRVNEHFKTNYSVQQVISVKKRCHITSEIDCKFKKGRVSERKGIKTGILPGMEKTLFKKGSRPHNAVPVGTEIVNGEGYHKTKVAEPNKWEFTQRLIYEKNHGPIPEDHMVIFKDGNKDNLSIDNLKCISKAVHFEMITHNMRSEFPEITDVNATLAELNIKIKKKKKEK